jgi:hypothetical protein
MFSTIVRHGTNYGPGLTSTGGTLVKMFVHMDQIFQNFKLGYAKAIKRVHRVIFNYMLYIPRQHENLEPSYGSGSQSPAFHPGGRVNVKPSRVGFLVDTVTLRQGFLRVLRYSTVINISPTLRTHAFVYHRH